MTTVARTFAVTTPAPTVLEYLKDFAHAADWDPGTQSCTQNGDGPVVVGTSWHNVSKIAGIEVELTYTLEDVGPDRLVFVGRNDNAISTDTITVTPSADGADVSYTASVEMQGVAKVATPLMKLLLEKLGHDTEAQMTEVLNALATSPS